ncbi:MAG TPA: phenylalanine--tRNA ligase subunit beta [Polyangiaceae bacterium]|nr:phenylalanine--tRNA ligase subunit beta [Polyangiaceae bacterium]
MKASHLWLRSLVPSLPADPAALAARFTAAGLEVEGTSVYGGGAESCVLAWVVSTRQHPTKSGLRLVTVDRGGGTLQEVVCGAPNVPEPGGVVVLAPLGTHLPAKGMTIGRRDIGGITSEGMLCSEAELGLTEDAEGILVFPAGFAQPGTPLTEAIPEAHDTIFEIGLTPNRPDGLGHIGLAREAAALFGIAWKVPEPEAPLREGGASADALVKVRIEDGERCPIYGAAIVEGSSIGASPHGVRYRLAALGVRPISNAVDVTNLVMLEYGHPMHAFDADKIRGGVIVVRRAKEGEALVTLDGETRKLVADDLVIADAEGPIALAGVMGGLASEITEGTKRIALECAYFDPRTVRRTARRHGLHSESSHRFERGVDHGDTERALRHAVGVTCRLAGGAAAKGAVVARGAAIAKVRVALRAERMRALLGIEVPMSEAKQTLERLGFEISAAKDGELQAVVPSHRPDVSREADLVDEVVRVRGMDTVPAALPAIRATRPVGGREALLRHVRAAAVSLGLSEALSYGFVSPKALAALGLPAAFTLQNPLTDELSAMRTSLLPGLFEAASRARRYGESDVGLFSAGSVFLQGAANGLPQERASFAAVLAGARPSYLTRPVDVDVWDASGLATALVSRLVAASATVAQIAPKDWEARAPRYLHPRGAATIELRGAKIGTLGPLHPDVVDALDLGGSLVIVELDLAALVGLGIGHPKYSPIPKHPASRRDIAFVVRNDVPAGDVLRAVREAAGPLAVDVQLFDRFTGSPVPEGHANLAFHVVYRAPPESPRTLTDAEVDASHAKVVAEMQRRFGAALRA